MMIPISSLETELKQNISGEVSFEEGARALYATDASNYRQIPIGVVIPKTIEEVIKTVEICCRHNVPILSRGAGTSLAGQGCNAAVVIDFSRHLYQILEIDPQKKTARVQPGVILDRLCDETKKYGLIFGPDPATHSRCTLGGMIGNNACGVHSVLAGKTVDNIVSLKVLTYEGTILEVEADEKKLEEKIKAGGRTGEIYKRLKNLRDEYAERIRNQYPKLPRRVSGYNLDQLLPENQFNVARALVGTEGTCVMVLEATLQLIENPAFRTLVVLGYSDIYEAAEHVPRILSFGPIGMEGLDEFFVRNMKLNGLHLQEIEELPKGEGWLIVEFGGQTVQEAEAKVQKMLEALKSDLRKPEAKWFPKPEDQKRIWALRESSFGATVFVPGVPDTFSGFEDSAVPPEKLGAYLRALRKLYDKYDYYAVTYGHFGDGCIHTRLSFDLKTESGIQKYKRFLEEAADLVVQFGGSFSGEHGDGQTWGHLLPKMYGHEIMEAFREFKSIWDPQNKMNPGKIIDSYPVDSNLKQKAYASWKPGPLHFDFFEEKGDFARTTERCIGIGKCLKTDEGTMCPSYMVTRDEKHSTRGRAHLLHEMMRGEVLKQGWKSEQVKEALDLCLACKACKSECPVKVDIATYKAEFLSHYFKGKLRPLRNYLFGFISVWAELGNKIPGLARLLQRIPFAENILKKIAGIAAQRKLPEFAPETFRQWFVNRGSGFGDRVSSNSIYGSQFPITNPRTPNPEVILWPDTFTNYFYPEIGKAAVKVLEHAGFRVELPSESLCCGRPLYDSGMLSFAKDFLVKTMNVLEPSLEKGAVIVGLEPSCIAVFRDELIRLFPGNQAAQKLNQRSYLLADFLMRYADEKVWPKTQQTLFIQGHCHQKSLIGMQAEENLFHKMGAAYKILDSGCCGMAGSFGFEADHYEVSVGAANRVLVPAVQNASSETVILTDGFSCREQIQQLTGKRALHLAEWLAEVLEKNE